MTESLVTSLTPCLWFDRQAEDAARFYASIFPNSRIDHIDRAAAAYPNGAEGDVLAVEFSLDGTPFVGLNGGPEFAFTEAVSFMIDCIDQEEVDRYWAKLTADGGQPGPCGWLKDRFGLSWQVVPRRLTELLRSDKRDGARRVMEAMLKMGKIEVGDLEQAFEAEPARA